MTQNATQAAPLVQPHARPTAVAAPRLSEPVKLQEPPLLDSERSPAYWTIVRHGLDGISATNTITNRVFNGAISEFNKLFK